jgi:hypothetical protein
MHQHGRLYLCDRILSEGKDSENALIIVEPGGATAAAIEVVVLGLPCVVLGEATRLVVK